MAHEIVRQGDPTALPHRHPSKRNEDPDARLLRTLLAITPTNLPAVSQLGFEAALGAMASATKLAISADLVCFGNWCRTEGRTPFPCDPEDLVRYIRSLEDAHKKPATQARRIASIARAHRLLGFGEREPLPTQARMVLDALKAARRRLGVAQKQAAPLRFGGDLSQGSAQAGFTIDNLLAACLSDFQGLRDAALLSTAYDAGLRVSELVGACVGHVEPSQDGSGILILPYSKTDQEGQGSYAWLSPDTMRRLSLWLEASGIEDGPLFRRVGIDRRRARDAIPPLPYHAIPGHSRAWQQKLSGFPATPAQVTYTIGDMPLSRQGVCLIYRRIALAAYDKGFVTVPVDTVHEAVKAISTHSLRVGLTQDLFAAGEDGSSVALALRWTSPTTALRYGRKLAVGQNAAARLLARVRK